MITRKSTRVLLLLTIIVEELLSQKQIDLLKRTKL
jgi:hypothetical protein